MAVWEGIETPFCTTREAHGKQDKPIFRSFGGYVVDMKVGKSARGQYCRLTVEHNYKLFKILLWPSEYENFKVQLKDAEKKLVVFDAEVKYDAKYAKANQFTIKENSMFKVF